jgi:hypothetical protein
MDTADTVAVPLPSYALCAVVLVTVRLSFLLAGFGKTMRIVRWWTARYSRSRRAALSQLERIVMRVSAAAALIPGRVRCLEQSTVGFILMRRLGSDVQLCLGVRPYGFQAHAWLEQRGQPIFEPGEGLRSIVRFPDFVS